VPDSKASKLPNPGKNTFRTFDGRYFAGTRNNPNPSRKTPILNRNIASIPPPMCLILKDRNRPNCGKNPLRRGKLQFMVSPEQKANASPNAGWDTTVTSPTASAAPSPRFLGTTRNRRNFQSRHLWGSENGCG
jgi:hypothetical protein